MKIIEIISRKINSIVLNFKEVYQINIIVHEITCIREQINGFSFYKKKENMKHIT